MRQRVARSRHFSSMQTVGPTDPGREASAEREQKMAALNYVKEAWAEARLDGIDDDCMAMSCLFAAFAELVGTYGEEAAATYPTACRSVSATASSRSKSSVSSRHAAAGQIAQRFAKPNIRFS